MKKSGQILKTWMILALLFCLGSTTIMAQNNVILKNKITNRLILSIGEKPTQSENGWLKSPKVVGADDDYYGRGQWELIRVPKTDLFRFRNRITKRYLLCTGNKLEYKRGSEGGWLSSWSLVGSDANYYGRANWRLVKYKSTGAYLIINAETNRVLLSAGEKPTKSEGGWLKSPKIVSADENYYARAVWFITGEGASLIGKGSKEGTAPTAEKPKPRPSPRVRKTLLKFTNSSPLTTEFTLVIDYKEAGILDSVKKITVKEGGEELYYIPGNAAVSVKAVTDEVITSTTIFNSKKERYGEGNQWCFKVSGFFTVDCERKKCK